MSFGEPTSQAHAVVKDPVCGAEMERADAAAAVDHRGTVYYFCSVACQQKFAAAPASYGGAAGAAGAPKP